MKTIAKETENRKFEHIKVCLDENVEFSKKAAGFEEIELIHRALPELNYSKIDTKANFFGKDFDLPILINSMTGGHEESLKINKILAQIALEFNIPMEVGSQRAAIENKKLIHTYKVARDVSSDVFLIGNIGASQLANEYGLQEVEKCIEMIDANALAIHLNPLQEALQKEGTLNYENLLGKIEKILERVKVPIIVKETGNGLSKEDLKSLKAIGVEYVDVGGAGGTSWAAIESFRHDKESESANVARNFWNWGIPTVVSTVLAVKMRLNVISTGGIRSGIDIAKAITCGAGMTGIALPFLKHAYAENLAALRTQMKVFEKELKTCMFLTKSVNIEELQSAEKIFFGKIKQWLDSFK